MRWAEVSWLSSPENASVASLKAAAHSASSSIAAAAVDSVCGDSVDVESALRESARAEAAVRRSRGPDGACESCHWSHSETGVTKGQKTRDRVELAQMRCFWRVLSFLLII